MKNLSRWLKELLPASGVLTCIVLTGCGASTGQITSDQTPLPALHGRIHGGNQPVAGASVQLFAAGTTGYGAGAVSILKSPVVSDSNGNFTITGDYTCPSSSSLLYIVATGGNPGLSSGSNPAIALTAVLGPCDYSGIGGYTLDPSSFINVNEVTTVAAVYSLAQFWQPNSLTVGTSSTNITGLSNAFATAQSLVDVSTGTAYAINPSNTNITVPQATINTLANILAACINTNGSDGNCGTLFSSVAAQNGSAPTDTIAATLDVALSPATNVSELFGLAASQAPFQPTVAATPNDLSLALVITYPGVAYVAGIAIDSKGNAWSSGNAASALANPPTGVLELSPAGGTRSGATGYTDGHFLAPNLVAVDSADNVWAVNNFGAYGISEFSNNGTPLTASGAYLTPAFPQSSPYHFVSIAIAGSNSVVLASSGAPRIVEVNASGALVNGYSEFSQTGLVNPTVLALDSAETLWVANAYASSNENLYHIDSSGNALSASPATGGGLYNPRSMATDHNRNVWVVNFFSATGFGCISEFDPNGNPISPSNGFQDDSILQPLDIAMDGDGDAWVANSFYSIIKINPSGQILSATSGYRDNSVNNPSEMAIDASGNIWIANRANFTKFIGIAAPVATPLGINGSFGKRP